MKRWFSSGLLCAALLLPGLGARAQVLTPDERDPYYRDRDPYYRGRPTSLIDQVMFDLDRAITNSNLKGDDQKNFRKAQDDLRKFQDKWARGKFDEDELNGAIGRMESLVNAKHMSGRDRDVLSDDLRALRDFRATRGRSVSGAYPYDYRR